MSSEARQTKSDVLDFLHNGVSLPAPALSGDDLEADDAGQDSTDHSDKASNSNNQLASVDVEEQLAALQPKTVPGSPDISPYESLHIRDPHKLQAFLTNRAQMLVVAGEKLVNVQNDLLQQNSERGNPRLEPQTVRNITVRAFQLAKKSKPTSAISRRAQIMSAEEWINADFSATEQQVIVGTPANPIIRPGTKNFIEAPEKALKTTTVMRLAMGMATGQSLFPALPTTRPVKVLYLHGELSPAEIKERTISAAQGLTVPKNFLQGRDLNANLITDDGQKAIRDLVAQHKPDVLVLDPWQSFIAGADENSFKDMSKATKFLDSLIEEFGVTLLIPIHQGKDHSRGARGHSTLAGWRDARIRLTPSGNLSVRVNVEPRWATPPKPFVLNFENGTVWPKSGSAWTGQTGKIRQFVESNGGHNTKTAIGEYLELTGDALRKALTRAEDAGAISINAEDVTLPSVQ